MHIQSQWLHCSHPSLCSFDFPRHVMFVHSDLIEVSSSGVAHLWQLLTGSLQLIGRLNKNIQSPQEKPDFDPHNGYRMTLVLFPLVYHQ